MWLSVKLASQEKAQKKFIEISHAYEARVKDLVLGMAVLTVSVDIWNQQLGKFLQCPISNKKVRDLGDCLKAVSFQGPPHFPSEAFVKVLSDSEKKAKYDKYGEAASCPAGGSRAGRAGPRKPRRL